MSGARAAAPPALRDRLRDLLGDGVVVDPAVCRDLALGGVAPSVVVQPADVPTLAAAVASVGSSGSALVPLGRGAHRALGYAPARYDVALSTVRLDRVLDYAPADMTVTVEAGVTVTALQDLLAGAGQWLPLDPPLPDETTIGGLVAADLGGTLRSSQGRVRDFVIGISVVTADGRCARAGGKVVKNVAGYDLMKLFTGSLGTLGVVTEVTLKVRPRPPVVRWVALAGDDRPRVFALGEAVPVANVEPLAGAVVLGPGDGRPLLVCCRLAGVEADVATARSRLLTLAARHGAEVVVDADDGDPRARALAVAVRDFARAAPGSVVARVAALPRRILAVTEAAMGIDGVRGYLVDSCGGSLALGMGGGDTDAACSLASVRALSDAHDARLIVERWPASLAETVEVWRPLPAAFPIMRRMKAALDPRGTLSPGRFVGRI